MSQVRTFLKWLVHEVVLVELFFGAIKIVGCSKIPDGAIMSCTAKIFQVEFALPERELSSEKHMPTSKHMFLCSCVHILTTY